MAETNKKVNWKSVCALENEGARERGERETREIKCVHALLSKSFGNVSHCPARGVCRHLWERAPLFTAELIVEWC